jgi:hypothetical protein
LLDGGPVLCDFVVPSLLSKEFNEGAGAGVRLLIVILLFNIYSKILFYLYLILFNIN